MARWERRAGHKKDYFVLLDASGRKIGSAKCLYPLRYCDCGCGELQDTEVFGKPRFVAYKAGKRLGLYPSFTGARMAVERACRVQSAWMTEQLARMLTGTTCIKGQP
jgi:hypothetical protein